MSSHFKSEFPLVPRRELAKLVPAASRKKFTKRYLDNLDLDCPMNGKAGMTWMHSREGILKRLSKHLRAQDQRVRDIMLAYAYDPDRSGAAD